MESIAVHNRHVDEALTSWFLIIQHHLNRHAPLKTSRVKSKRSPEWLTPDILNARRMRDTFKRAENWQEYKKFRNVMRDLIRKAKKKHFLESIASKKNMKTIWKHFRSFTNKNNCSSNTLPEELIIDDEFYTDSKDIAAKLNEFFAALSDTAQCVSNALNSEVKSVMKTRSRTQSVTEVTEPLELSNTILEEFDSTMHADSSRNSQLSLSQGGDEDDDVENDDDEVDVGD